MKIFSFKGIATLIVGLLSLYTFYWGITSLTFKSKLNEILNENSKISYNKIKISGFPLYIQSTVYELKVLGDNNESSSINTPAIEFSMHPFDINNIAIRSNKINLRLTKDGLVNSLLLDGIGSKIGVSNNKINEFSFAINEALALVDDIKISKMNKIQLSIIESEKSNYEVSGAITSAKLYLFNQDDVNILLSGKANYYNNKINGNFKISLINKLDNIETLSIPIKIENNEVFFLFFSVFNLDELFSFF